jgi:hypothetical protein
VFILVSDDVKEFITVNGKLVYNFVDDRLNLHEGEETAPNLLVQDLLEGSSDFVR